MSRPDSNKTSSDIEKRLKRHLIGKVRTFYVSTPPGIERLCVDELSALGIETAGAVLEKGGIEFPGRVHECYLANLHLRLANRILMRIDTFSATDFNRLEQKAADIPWELYLHPRSAFFVHVTAKHSRLFHSEAISERIRKGIARRRQEFDTGSSDDVRPVPQRIFVRAVDDRFTLSLDSSGDLLHKRGVKTTGGRAPIRETVAAAVLALAGYRGDMPLVDPMCGSGTFSLEGAMIANRIPAGIHRDFAFMGWPCFRPRRWEFIRREAIKTITLRSAPVVFASDRNDDSCRKLENVVHENDLSGTVSVVTKDFFDLHPADIHVPAGMTKKGLVVINPPYGRRLQTRAESRDLFVEIGRKLKKDFSGWKVALIAPDRRLAETIPFSIKIHPIFHGGLHLNLLTGTI